MAGQRKRALSLGDGDNGKRLRVPVEEQEEELAEEEAVVVAAAMEEPQSPQISLTIRVSLFHCQSCLLPLNPPIFKCEAEHVVCGTCRSKHGQVCSRAGTYASCRELDAVLLDAKLPCQYAEFGCKSLVSYCRAADHHIACPSAPCFCPAPGCGFASSPNSLVEHFCETHSWPITSISYGRQRKLAVSEPEGWHVLVGEGDRSVFLVSACALGAATAVSLVCVATNGAAAAGSAQFSASTKLRVELPTNKNKMVMISSTVGTSDLAQGFPKLDENMSVQMKMGTHDEYYRSACSLLF